MKVEKRIEKFRKEYGYQPQAFEVCPRFDRCAVNKCPLHGDYSKLKISPFDREKKCRMPKRIRKEIGLYFGLANKGLTNREISTEKIWQKLSLEEKEARKEKLRKISPFSRLKSKGYGITRVGKPDSDFTLRNKEKMPKTRQESEDSKKND